MRKTKTCVASAIRSVTGPDQRVRLIMRTCDRPRAHDGDHYDRHGNWRDATDE